MEKIIRFDAVDKFAPFRFADVNAFAPGTFQRVSARKAAPAAPESGPAMLEQFVVPAGTRIVIEVPDPIPPTSEEVAAQRRRMFGWRVEQWAKAGREEAEGFA